MTVAELLAASRNAHRQGREAVRKRDRVKARRFFAFALETRLEARKADSGHTDPAWGDDLKSLHTLRQFDTDLGRRLLKKSADEKDPDNYDVPSTLVGREIADIDAALEAYYRHQLGETQNVVTVTGPADQAVIPPDQWQTFSDGVTSCANCAHPEHDGLKCGVSEFVDGVPVRCQCADFAPASCRHVFVPDHATQRTCKACGEVQRLTPTIAKEDTLAFQQLQREQSGKA